MRVKSENSKRLAEGSRLSGIRCHCSVWLSHDHGSLHALLLVAPRPARCHCDGWGLLVAAGLVPVEHCAETRTVSLFCVSTGHVHNVGTPPSLSTVWIPPTGHRTFLRGWINVSDVDSTSQKVVCPVNRWIRDLLSVHTVWFIVLLHPQCPLSVSRINMYPYISVMVIKYNTSCHPPRRQNRKYIREERCVQKNNSFDWDESYLKETMN